MHSLLIEVDGRQLRFDEERVVKIGRSIDADVVLAAMSVSRAHAELRPAPGGWKLVDVGSNGGTFIDGDPVAEAAVLERVEVRCGPGDEGSTFTVIPIGDSSSDSGAVDMPDDVPEPAPAPEPPMEDSDGYQHTLAPGALSPIEGEMARSGPDLLVVAAGREHRFRHPATITIGRRRECDVVISDPSVSRKHGQVMSTEGGWSYQNLSEDGSYVSGRLVEQKTFDEPVDVRLGHPVAGEKLQLVPILSAEEELRRFAAKRRKRGVLIGAAVAFVGLALTTFGLVMALNRDDGGPVGGSDTMATLTHGEADIAKAASVFIAVPDDSDAGTIVGSGSGTVVSEDGLILTNAHVADPDAIPRYADDGANSPEYVIVSLTDPDNGFRAGDEMYRARVVESDGDLDIALLQVYATAAGKTIDPNDLHLPAMPLGDSDDVNQGDGVTVLGFPSIAGSEDNADDLGDLLNQVTQTSGSVATIVGRGDDPRAVFDVTARIAPGNSGGAAINNDGELIGVPSRIKSDPSGTGVTSGRVAPLDYLASIFSDTEIEVP